MCARLKPHANHTLTFAVWAMAASKPPAVPYLPQPAQTAVNEGSAGTCC